MNLLDITFHSLRRQKGKKSILVAAMGLSLCASLILFTFVRNQERELESQFDEYGANIVVTPRSDELSLNYGGLNLSGIVTNVREIKAEDVSRIHTIENKQNIRAVSPKLIGLGRVASGPTALDALIVGVDFDVESKIKPWWALEGGYPDDTYQVVAGSAVAEKMNLQVGGTVDIGGRDLTVAGILTSTGSQDDSALLAPLAFVEDYLGKPGKVSIVEVSALCSDCPIDEIVSQISAVMPNAEVRAVRAVMEQRMRVVRQFSTFAVSIFGVLAVLCGLFIFATITGAVSERRREIGVMRAVGFTGSHIARVVLTEALILGFLAGIVGIVVAFPVLKLALPLLVDVETVVFAPAHIAFSFTALVFIAVLSAIVPAAKAARFDPVEAIASL